jgi:hypothetical protein
MEMAIVAISDGCAKEVLRRERFTCAEDVYCIFPAQVS